VRTGLCELTGVMTLRHFALVALAVFSIVAIACSGGSGDIEPAVSYDSLSADLRLPK
jgi:hypothetical protein